jgi:hypothetical protein
MSRRFSVLGAGFWVLVLGAGLLFRLDVAAAQAPVVEYEELKKELLAMREQDQKFRDNAAFSMNPTEAELAILQQQDAIDRANVARLGQIVQKYGWPGIKQVGEQASSAAFLIVQHAGLEDQRRYFPILKAAVAQKNARPDQVAMLEDRILLREGKNQVYGTQLRSGPETGGKLVLHPIDDARNVDARRAAVGLKPLTEYLKEFGIDYTPPK